MKAINFKLATFSFAALLLASCSDSSNDSNSGSSERNTTVVGAAITSVTDAQELASRVHNYKTSTTNTKTRAYNGSDFSEVTSMPEQPATPSDAEDIRKTKNEINIEGGKSYKLTGSEVFNTSNLKYGSTEGLVTIYVEDGATLEYSLWHWNSWAFKVIVKKGGKLICNNNSAQDCEIDNYGTIVFKEGNIVTAKTFRNAGDLDLSGRTFDVQGKCYIGGNLTADKLYNNTGMTMYITGDCNIESTEQLKLSGSKLYVGNKFSTGGDLQLNSNALFVSGCSVNVPGELNISGADWEQAGSILYVDYLKASSITLAAKASIRLKNGSMISCTGTFASNNQDTSISYLDGDNAVAVIKAGTITFNNGSALDNANTKYAVTMFGTPGKNSKIVVWDSKFTLSGNEITPEFQGANVFLSSDDDNASDVVIKKTDCNSEGWNDDKKEDDKKDEDKKGNLDKITVIDYDSHDHDISATGIMELNNKLYMSYHTRGDVSSTSKTGHGGCVEVFTPVTENKVEMKQYLYDSALDLDFNHLLAVSQNDGKKKVYMPGSSYKKGAMLAYMDILNNGLLNTESTAITTSGEDGKSTITYNEPLQYIQMNPATGDYKGYDENCVVYNDKTDHFIVMTTKGYIIYDSDYNEVARCTPATGKGKAKHVAIGDGKIITLVLDEEVTEGTEQAIPAHVYIYDQASENLTDENPTSFSVSTIQPNNGKNVIAINNGLIYVCRGGAGMYVYDLNGTEQWHYQMPNAQILSDENGKSGNFKALANGLFVDDKYVYVAYGSHGLVVLDKTTHKVVARRAETKSANYVYVYDGYIYVAYGRDRLQVFKLYPNGIEGSDTNYNTDKD